MNIYVANVSTTKKIISSQVGVLEEIFGFCAYSPQSEIRTNENLLSLHDKKIQHLRVINAFCLYFYIFSETALFDCYV